MLNIGTKFDFTAGASGELTAGEFNDHNVEIQGVVTQTGQSLSVFDSIQLGKANFIYSTSAQSMVDNAPSVNVIELTPETGAAGLRVFDSYDHADGAILEFYKILANNNATVFINVGQTIGTLLGAKSLKLYGGINPVVGQIAGYLRIKYDKANNYWVLVGKDVNLEDTQTIELGANKTGDRTCFIDLHSDDTYTDYGARMIKLAGANGACYITTRGTGGLYLQTVDVASVRINTNQVERFQITGTGHIVYSGTGVAGSTPTPSYFKFPFDYSNGVTRDKLKIYLLDDGGTEKYGFTVGSSSGDIQYHTNGTHDFYVNNIKKFNVFSGGVTLFGVAGSTPTPTYIKFPNDISNGVTRDKLKIYLFDDGSTEKYGFTVGTTNDIQYHSSGSHDFYIDNTKKLSIVSGSITIFGGTGSTLEPSYLKFPADFSNGGTRDKLKIYLLDDGGTEKYGFTVGSSSNGDIQYHTNGSHDFYISNVATLRIQGGSNTLGIAAGVYPDALATLTDYPIGSYVVVDVSAGLYQRNTLITVYYMATTGLYSDNPGGTLLAGTWRASGMFVGASNYCLARRVA